MKSIENDNSNQWSELIELNYYPMDKNSTYSGRKNPNYQYINSLIYNYSSIPRINTGISISETPRCSKSQINCSKYETPVDI